MIERSAEIPNNILVLDRKESFGDYARSYGHRIAEHYENNGIIVIPFMPIACDLAFLQSITMPHALKKIGTVDGIEHSIITRNENTLVVNQTHPLLRIFNSTEIALYLQNQIAQFNAQLRRGLSILFPHYYSLHDGNITWRMTETFKEGMHLDIYQQGAPLLPTRKIHHRLKLFINIDTIPRQWQTSLSLPNILKTCRAQLPDELPDDVNVINDIIDRHGVLKHLPFHRIAFPTLSAVFANGETVAHEVVYGRRVIGVEAFCDYHDMLAPEKHSHHAVKHWLMQSGYTIGADAAAIHARYTHMKGSYERLKEEQAAS